MEKRSTCCFTGHRPSAYSFGYDESADGCKQMKATLGMYVYRAIKNGFTHFITGMAMGADMWAAEVVLYYKKEFPHITLEAAVPCPSQTDKWGREMKERYERILSLCDKVTVISPKYTSHCMHERDRYMVDHSDLCLAVYNGKATGGTAYTVRYAREKHLVVKIINPMEF